MRQTWKLHGQVHKEANRDSKGRGHQERRDENAELRCPKCNMRLWAKPIPKPIRFHDLRTTFATHLHERTRDIQLVQKMLGHSSPTITAAIYSCIRDDYARAGVNKLRFLIHRTETVIVSGNGAENVRYGAEQGFGSGAEHHEMTGTLEARAAGVEPATFGSGERPRQLPRVSQRSQGFGRIRNRGGGYFARHSPA